MILKETGFCFLMVSTPFLIAGIICLLILIFLMTKFEYIILTIRKIAEDPGGYFKFGQLVIVFFVIISFLVILSYNILVPQEVSSTDVFLAVIIGIIGTIVGLYFGPKAEEFISHPRKELVRELVQENESLSGLLEKSKKQIKNLEEKSKKE